MAIEQYFPKNKRLINDDLAYRILPWSMRAFLQLMRPRLARSWMIRESERGAPGIWAGMACRKRYIDDKLAGAEGVEAVVNLGTGFDTRPYRLPFLFNLPVWEVDQPENIALKKSRLCALLGEIPPNVNLVPTDFNHEDLGTVLDSHGYSLDSRTFFIWEGVTQYLSEQGIRNTFDFLSRATCGSRIVFTYVIKDFLEGKLLPYWEKGYRQYVVKGTWVFGMEPGVWPDFLESYGWKMREDVGYDEMAEKYVRPTGRKLASTPIERMVYAEKL